MLSRGMVVLDKSREHVVLRGFLELIHLKLRKDGTLAGKRKRPS